MNISILSSKTRLGGVEISQIKQHRTEKEKVLLAHAKVWASGKLTDRLAVAGYKAARRIERNGKGLLSAKLATACRLPHRMKIKAEAER